MVLYLPTLVRCWRVCDMEAVNLNNNNTVFNIELCIFCQKYGGKLTEVTQKTRNAIQEASAERKDEISERLAFVGTRDFVYHCTNQCYKSYTNKTNIKRLSLKREIAELESTSNAENKEPDASNNYGKSRKSLRGTNVRSSPNPQSSVDIMYKVKCIICDHLSHKKVFKKSLISEDHRAVSFKEATNYFKDDIYTRTCDLQSPSSMYGADLYYHQVCIQNYISHYETELGKRPSQLKSNEKDSIWQEALPLLEEGLAEGKGYELNVIRDYLNSKMSETCAPFTNQVIKLLLTNRFSDNIDFAYPDERNNCLMVFSVEHNEVRHLAEKIRSVDPTQLCASKIRKELLHFDFHLNDQFCDAVELMDSLYKFTIPETTLKFFGKIFNFQPASHHEISKEIIRESCDYQDEPDEDEDDNSVNSSRTVSKSRCRQVQSLFQIMFYVLHSGRKRTPMHLMNGVWAQSLGDGGSMFTRILNNLGLASSYEEILRYQHDMAGLSVKNQNDSALIPAHFQKEQFTSGAFDNWDHEGERVSVHDTVAVLYQDSSSVATYKPKISEAGIVHGPRAFATELKCQQLLEFFKPAKRPDFPSDVIIEPSILEPDECDESYLFKVDMAWSLSRLNLQCILSGNMSDLLFPNEQNMPSWKAYNAIITDEEIPVKKTAFLPILPYPCTEYSTVYTAMKNFVSISDELEQEKIPIYCDEKVYCIVKEIQFLRKKEFECIIPCLGSFHTIKTLLKCIGKSLRGTGVETLFLDAAGYGPAIVEGSILGGKHYNRSLEAFSLLSESLIRLIYKEFFSSRSVETYETEIECLLQLKLHVSEMDVEKSKSDLLKFCSNEHLLNDFKAFILERKESNENFRYWIAFINKMQVVFDMLRADREGNWNLHLDALQRSLYEFAAWDSFNYLRWGSVYLEEMRLLKDTCPHVFEHFSGGSFSIKTNEGKFTAVGGDQKLEQTINLASKKSNSVIYNSKNRNLVAKWDLIYHEILAVKSLHSSYSSVFDSSFEGFQHHESSKAFTERLENQVQSVIRFIETKGSPLSGSAPKTLHNFVSKEIMPEVVRTDLLNASDTGKERYIEHRSNKFVQKTERISATIHKMNLSNMSSANKPVPEKTTKQVVKEISLNERKLEIARDRGVTSDILLVYDLIDSKLLYDGNHLTKPAKSQLTTEIEKKLVAEDYCYAAHGSRDLKCAFVVDVMANIRKIPCKNLFLFGEMVSQFHGNFSTAMKNGRLNFVFDVYHDEPSVKDCERLRRQEMKPVNLSEVKNLTPLPKDLKTFWSSDSNKYLLEQLIYTSALSLNSNHSIVVGQLGPNDDEWKCVASDGNSPFVPYMTTQPYLEEADLQIVLYVLDSVKCGFPRITVFSNDTDVMVTLLYHMQVFLLSGLKELWVKGGAGDATRYIPVHTLYEKVGAEVCSVLPAVHSLTGCDITSKVGTKKAALDANPVQFLRSFGSHPLLTESDISGAEQFLCDVLAKNHDCKNFQELRIHLYNFSTDKTHWNLPPTSTGLLPHIQRSFYNTYTLTHVIDGQYAPLNPQLYGFGLEDSLLLPTRAKKELDDSWTTMCKCTNCSRSTCSCRTAKVKCVRFCGCNKRGDCKNPF